MKLRFKSGGFAGLLPAEDDSFGSYMDDVEIYTYSMPTFMDRVFGVTARKSG
jgi:hypothetical protein